MTNRKVLAIIAALNLCTSAFAGVTVKSGEMSKGPVKIMNAVNNGPIVSDKGGQDRDNFEAYKDARIPFARTHDAALCVPYGAEHTVDITAIFPDFSKDVNDPASYDFVMTDYYLGVMRKAGTEPFFRLGQKIENNKKKYGIFPPSDYQKWAEICEHIIRHYNEGWANGFKWNIQYWEIWNEADNNESNWNTQAANSWGGPKEEFFKFFSTALSHLNKCFPDLKIGGPALAWNIPWAEEFVEYIAARGLTLDFFSYHCYTDKVETFVKLANTIREILDKNGYGYTEAILNEWNYIKGWKEEYQYSMDQISGLKGAAFVAATFCTLQDQPVDMLMYYDARIGTLFNGLFDAQDFAPTESYYAFYAWAKLLDLGSQMVVDVEEDDVYAVAATDGSKKAVFIARYNDDNNIVVSEYISVDLGENGCNKATAHLTDHAHKYTEIPLYIENGVTKIKLEPNSFIMIEY